MSQNIDTTKQCKITLTIRPQRSPLSNPCEFPALRDQAYSQSPNPSRWPDITYPENIVIHTLPQFLLESSHINLLGYSGVLHVLWSHAPCLSDQRRSKSPSVRHRLAIEKSCETTALSQTSLAIDTWREVFACIGKLQVVVVVQIAAAGEWHAIILEEVGIVVASRRCRVVGVLGRLLLCPEFFVHFSLGLIVQANIAKTTSARVESLLSACPILLQGLVEKPEDIFVHFVRLLSACHGNNIFPVALAIDFIPIATFFTETSVIHSHLWFQGGFTGPSLTTFAKSDVLNGIKSSEAKVVIIEPGWRITIDDKSRNITQCPRRLFLVLVLLPVLRRLQEGNIHGTRRITKVKRFQRRADVKLVESVDFNIISFLVIFQLLFPCVVVFDTIVFFIAVFVGLLLS
ncbi:hypothetical protein HG531_011983 [Fusarium graminearum]|nr:hypothetical protein HG531_011983 [Fusarium graminearum]